MPTRAASALNTTLDAYEAGRAAASEAVVKLGDLPDLLLVFATARHDQQRLIAGIRAVSATATLVGCSGEGVIANACSEERERAVSVMAVRSDGLRFEGALVEGYGTDPVGCGTRIGRWAAGFEDAQVLLLFPDGLVGNCTRLIDAVRAQVPAGLPVVGATAADGMRFDRTFQYLGGEVASEAVSALLVRGRGTTRVAVSHGCEALGLPRRVTDAADGWVRTIDDRPAWSVFKEYLHGDPQDLNADGIVHLCIGEPLEGAAEYGPLIIRTPLRLDPTNGALFFPGGGLEADTPIHLTRRDPDRIRRSARECAEQIRGEGGPRPALVLQFDCAGRGKVLFGRGVSDTLVRPLREAVGDEVPWIGFHGYGEIAPVGGEARYHNYAVVLCALFDERADGEPA